MSGGSRKATRRYGPYAFELSKPEKILFPERNLTKRDLVEYYERVAETMLPYVRGRPITMHRFPDGIRGGSFYQKETPDYFPGWIRTVRVSKEGGHNRQVVIENAATLAYLAGQGCIAPHVWLSRADRLRTPDRLILDLDPPGDDFAPVRAAARALRGILEDLGLVAYVMTTGSKGLHVVVPLRGGTGFDGARDFARRVAGVAAARDPERLTLEQRKDKRGDRVFLDFLRNAYGQHGIAPYGVRALPGAPVATPLSWDEIDDADLSPRRYTIENLFRRLGVKDDPWKGMQRHARGLSDPRRRLKRRESASL